MALELEPDVADESLPMGWKERVKGAISTAVDLAPFVGTFKLLGEAVRGVTVDGFQLSPMERGAYYAIVTCRGISYMGIIDVAQGHIVDGGALFSMGVVGNWTFFALGKARHTGAVLSFQSVWTGVNDRLESQGERVDEVCRRVYFSIEPVMDRLVREE